MMIMLIRSMAIVGERRWCKNGDGDDDETTISEREQTQCKDDNSDDDDVDHIDGNPGWEALVGKW